jgi:hypothetical protein
LIPFAQFAAFAKAAGVPTEAEKRPRVQGMKQPRLATPRLGAKKLPGNIPANPFRGNWAKVASLGHAALGVGALGVAGATGVGVAKALRDPNKRPGAALGGASVIRAAAKRNLGPLKLKSVRQPPGV